MNLLSVDPGKFGYLSFFEDGILKDVKRMPPLNKKEGVEDFKSCLRNWQIEECILERITPRKGNSIQSIETSCVNYGKLIAILQLSNIQVEEIYPSAWKKLVPNIETVKKNIGDKKLKCLSYIYDSYSHFVEKENSSKWLEGLVDSVCLGMIYVTIKIKDDCNKIK